MPGPPGTLELLERRGPPERRGTGLPEPRPSCGHRGRWGPRAGAGIAAAVAYSIRRAWEKRTRSPGLA